MFLLLLLVLLGEHVTFAPLPSGEAPSAVVHTLTDLFSWVDHSVSYAAWAIGKSLEATKQELRAQLPGYSMSTSFSGIGAPENALNSISCYLGINHGPVLFAIEWDQECRRELSIPPHPPRCIYIDINDLWNVPVGNDWALADYNAII